MRANYGAGAWCVYVYRGGCGCLCWSNACKELGIRKGGIRIKPMEERL